ncbi:MAG TPA: tryptophan 7-halogenase [Steroidobacteraceae bacterium]
MQPPAHDLASGVIEPLDSTSIHLIQRGITRLMQMFPGAGIRPSDIDEYDEQTWQEIEYIRDFIVLHYHVTNRQDSPFWRACRGMEIPESLKHRIGLIRETGRVPRHQAYVDQYCKAAPAASAPG